MFSGGGFGGDELHVQLVGTPGQLAQSPFAQTLLSAGLALVRIFLALGEHGVDQSRQFVSGGGGDGFGFVHRWGLRWTFARYIAIMQYMKAIALARSKEVRDDGTIAEVVVWELQEPLQPCKHRFKYRLFYGRPGEERVRYDNERGKGDHRHFSGVETVYEFVSLDRLLDDFEHDIQTWRAP